MTDSNIEVSPYLRRKQSELLARWCKIAERDESFGPTDRLSYEEFLDDIPFLLGVFLDYMQSAGSEGDLGNSRELLRRHAKERWRQNFNLEELLWDWGILNRVVTEAVNGYFEEFPPDAKEERADAIRKTCCFFAEAISKSVARFDELRRDEATEKVKELERMRRYFERISEARQSFLSGVSHDIGGSLTAIAGVSDLLKRGELGQDQSTREKFGDIIEDSVSSAVNVLDVLLQVAHIDAGKEKLNTEPTRLVEFIESCVEKVSTEKESAVSLRRGDAEEIESDIDRDKLRRTVEILFDFAEANFAEAPIRIVFRSKADSWILDFRFHGSGVQEEDQVTTKERRREISRLLLERLCLVQKGSCSIKRETEDAGEVVVSLRFPFLRSRAGGMALV